MRRYIGGTALVGARSTRPRRARVCASTVVKRGTTGIFTSEGNVAGMRAAQLTKDREEAARGATRLVSSHLLSLVEDLCTDLLIVVRGKRVFFGPMEEARSQFSEHRLEDLFFQATST